METKAAIIKRLKADIARQHRKAVDISELASAIEFRREQYGLNCKEFAELLGIKNSHYSEFMRNKRGLPLEARKNAFAIGVPAQFLLRHEKKVM